MSLKSKFVPPALCDDEPTHGGKRHGAGAPKKYLRWQKFDGTRFTHAEQAAAETALAKIGLKPFAPARKTRKKPVE